VPRQFCHRSLDPTLLDIIRLQPTLAFDRQSGTMNVPLAIDFTRRSLGVRLTPFWVQKTPVADSLRANSLRKACNAPESNNQGRG
jgi:hypothetical protein